MGLGWRGEVPPDKGGDQADSQRLPAARDAWQDALKEARPQKEGPQSSGSKRARATASDTSLGRGLGTRRGSGSQEGRRSLWTDGLGGRSERASTMTRSNLLAPLVASVLLKGGSLKCRLLPH